MGGGCRRTEGRSQGRFHKSVVGVISSLWVVGASSPSELGMLWESLTPVWGCQEPLSLLGQESPSSPSFSSPPPFPQLPAPEFSIQQMCQAPALPLSLFSSFPVHIWGNPWACSWPPIPAVLGLHVGEGRFRHLINLDLICK